MDNQKKVDKALYDELVQNYDSLKDEYNSLQDLFMREIQGRNDRELEMLRRIYPYLANELDALKINDSG